MRRLLPRVSFVVPVSCWRCSVHLATPNAVPSGARPVHRFGLPGGGGWKLFVCNARLPVTHARTRPCCLAAIHQRCACSSSPRPCSTSWERPWTGRCVLGRLEAERTRVFAVLNYLPPSPSSRSPASTAAAALAPLHQDDAISSEFTFINPNAKGACGCGESFNV